MVVDSFGYFFKVGLVLKGLKREVIWVYVWADNRCLLLFLLLRNWSFHLCPCLPLSISPINLLIPLNTSLFGLLTVHLPIIEVIINPWSRRLPLWPHSLLWIWLRSLLLRRLSLLILPISWWLPFVFVPSFLKAFSSFSNSLFSCFLTSCCLEKTTVWWISSYAWTFVFEWRRISVSAFLASF